MAQEKGNNSRNSRGQLTGSTGLTERQQRFLRLYAKGASQSTAARLAGYSRPESAGWHLSKLPQIASAMHALQARELRRLANVALGVLRQVLEDPEAGDRVKVDAAKTVLDRAGHIAPKAQDTSDPAQKDLEDLSVDELERFIADAKARAAERATPIIEGEAIDQDTPHLDEIDDQPIDTIDNDTA